MKVFKVTGSFKAGNGWQKFTRETLAKNEKSAVEFIYSDIGGKHRANRREIQITKVKAISPEDVENLVLKQMMDHEMVDL